MAQTMDQMRQQLAAQQQQLAALAQQREAAARAQKAPTPPAPSDLQVINERILNELGTNPLRVLSELQTGAKEAAKAEVLDQVRNEQRERDAAQRAAQYAQWVMSNNPDLQGREWQIGQYVDWAAANRPDIQTYEQRVQFAVQAAREQATREREQWLAQQHHEAQMRAGVAMPRPGAYGAMPGGPPRMSPEEARRARLSVYHDRKDVAMRGAYPRTPVPISRAG